MPPCAAPLNDDPAWDALIDAADMALSGKPPPPVAEPPTFAAAFCEMLIPPFVMEPDGVYGGRFAVAKEFV